MIITGFEIKNLTDHARDQHGNIVATYAGRRDLTITIAGVPEGCPLPRTGTPAGKYLIDMYIRTATPEQIKELMAQLVARRME